MEEEEQRQQVRGLQFNSDAFSVGCCSQERKGYSKEVTEERKKIIKSNL